MRDLAVLLGFDVVGTVATRCLPWPFPGTVLGMLLLTGAIACGWIRPAWVEQGAQFLLNWLALFFVPLVVGGIGALGAMGWRAAELLAILAISTTLGLVTTGWVVGWESSSVRSGGHEDVG